MLELSSVIQHTLKPGFLLMFTNLLNGIKICIMEIILHSSVMTRAGLAIQITP